MTVKKMWIAQAKIVHVDWYKQQQIKGTIFGEGGKYLMKFMLN
jgi:hypothetical protein